MKHALLWLLMCLAVSGCDSHKLEHRFFREDPATRLARLRRYSLPDQYRIFRYGNDVVEPPDFALARPIAERGAEAVPFLLDRLDKDKCDIAVRDISLILEVMAASKSYAVASDATLMGKFRAAVSGVKDNTWRGVCEDALKNISEPGPTGAAPNP